jgi:hypothetical protein
MIRIVGSDGGRDMNEHSIYTFPRHYTPEEIASQDTSPKADELRKLRESLDEVNKKLRDLDKNQR